MAFTITVDTGGTFTDLVLSDDERIVGLYKAHTTPEDMFAGIEHALALAAKENGTDTGALLRGTRTFIYSTTRSTNAIIEGKTARTAFLTTDGHRDILLYREGGKERPLDISVPYPEPYVPRSLTFGIRERVLADGTVHTPLDEAQAIGILGRLRELDVEAVAVCLLWSIVEPSHEIRLGALIREHLPDVEFTLSHELNPIIREYRRASGTVIDASLKPLMRRHLEDIDRRLRDLGFAGEPLMVTHLSGGVLHMHDMCEQPLHSVDSGPALAPVAGLAYARAEAVPPERDVIVVDAGGTSFDISPTRSGQVIFSREKWLGPRWAGHMTGLPAVETRSVGAGGGSIASVDAAGLLTVGPRSAGAKPGPACYGQGGRDATVTDAAVVLGYIDPRYFLGGRVQLDAQLAADAVRASVAVPLGLSLDAAAAAVMTVFTENIRSFLFDTANMHGMDLRMCLVVAGGGAAGLNIVAAARELGVGEVLIPTMAAGLSAVGGQFSDIVASFSRSFRTNTAAFDHSGVNAVLASLASQIDAFSDGLAGDSGVAREFFCEARYANQLWELNLPLGDRDRFTDAADVAELQKRFDALHEQVYAVQHPGETVETITWRGDARIRRPEPAMAQRSDGVAADHAAARRSAVFDGERLPAPVHKATALPNGSTISGPAFIDEPTTTIVLPPGSRAIIHPTHYLVEVTA